MANFELALKVLFKIEGGYSNRKEDTGGETYRGISRKWWPNWDGWETIDEAKSSSDFKSIITASAELNQKIRSFYELNFWNPIKGYAINSQNLATKILSFTVLMGLKPAIRCLQRSCRCASDNQVLLEEDGILGLMTLGTINSLQEYKLIYSFKSECANHLINNSQPENINGWLNRAYS